MVRTKNKGRMPFMSLLLALCMALTLFSAQAFAASETDPGDTDPPQEETGLPTDPPEQEAEPGPIMVDVLGVELPACDVVYNGSSQPYYGLNALSNNLIMVDRKLLKNPKGVYRKGTGTPRKQQAVRPQAAQGRGKGRAKVILTVVYHRQPNMERGLILCRQ